MTLAPQRALFEVDVEAGPTEGAREIVRGRPLAVSRGGRHDAIVHVAPIHRYGVEATSVFDLLGHNEVALTSALGWTLSRSPWLVGEVLQLLEVDEDPAGVSILLEEADAQGRTDLELTTAAAKIIVEAKQGWIVPGESQLAQYRGRFEGFESGLLVSLSDSSEVWARDQLPTAIDGVPVRHLPWDALRSAISRSRAGTAGSGEGGTGRPRAIERLWLQEMGEYMGRATSQVPYDDQWVFCVVVSDDLYGEHTFREYVVDKRVYFHPFGGNNTWPKAAPNFLCFRWGGVVRQVNRVTSFEVLSSLRERWPAMPPEGADSPHIVYELGPDIPLPEISTRGTYATGRVWTLLDQLLVHPTLAEAVRASKTLAG